MSCQGYMSCMGYKGGLRRRTSCNFCNDVTHATHVTVQLI
jgi:hypothetical protein